MVEERNGTTPDRPNNSRRRKAMTLFVVAALVTVGSGAFYWWYRQTHISTDDAYVEGRIHPVAARIPGTVVEVLVEDNQPVKQGDPVLRIDPEPFAVRVDAAGSAVTAATADLTAARSDITAAMADIQAARQDLAASKAQLVQARLAVEAARSKVSLSEAQLAQAVRDADRAKNLFEGQSVSRERWEKARTEQEVSQARHDLAKEELRLAEAAIPTREAIISQREAMLAQREASLAQRKARVGQQHAVVRQRESALAEAKLYRRPVGCVGGGELQGDPDRADPPRPQGHHTDRHLLREEVPREGGKHHGGNRIRIFPLSPRKRHGELCQGRAACPGEDRARPGGRPGTRAADRDVGRTHRAPPVTR
jgi:membrane fusion protein (multidrug efflux system)